MLNVVCAIILKGNKILVTQHKSHPFHQNKWEFPGGKIEPGESKQEAIVREIKEELELDIIVLEELQTIEHSYPHQKIRLIPLICTIMNGEIVLKQHRNYQWLDLEQLFELDLCKADKELIRHLGNREKIQCYLGKT